MILGIKGIITGCIRLTLALEGYKGSIGWEDKLSQKKGANRDTAIREGRGNLCG